MFHAKRLEISFGGHIWNMSQSVLISRYCPEWFSNINKIVSRMRFLQGWPETRVIVTLICIVSSYHNAKGPLLEYLADREYFVEERLQIEEEEIQTPLAFNWLIKRHRMIQMERPFITVSNDPNALFREKYEYREPLCKILFLKVSCKKILCENKIVITLLCITILVMFYEKGFTKYVHWSCEFRVMYYHSKINVIYC